MQRRRLGRTGPELSLVGLGCNNFGMKVDAAESMAVVDAALEVGVNHFDTAETYGDGASEEFLGAALLPSLRDEVVIATKFAPRPAGQPYEAGALAKRIRDACEASLRRLGTDRIDLYYQHYPDPEAPMEEVLQALDDLVNEGKVLHIASSNVTSQQLSAADAVATSLPTVSFCGVQAEWNLLNRDVEDALVPSATRAGMGIVPYFPLASGMLTGKYRRSEPFPEGSRLSSLPYFADVATEANFDRVEELAAFAASCGRTLAELAIAWLGSHDTVASVIAGATTPEQVRANAAAATWDGPFPQ
jgi:aryl-alcohol dehydrogenase-like predicted oxidoreductase